MVSINYGSAYDSHTSLIASMNAIMSLINNYNILCECRSLWTVVPTILFLYLSLNIAENT